MKRPEKGFSIHMTEGVLRVPGKTAHQTDRPTIQIRVSGIHKRDIEISLQTARNLTQTAIDHSSNPLRDYAPSVQEAAYAWSDRSDQLPGDT